MLKNIKKSKENAEEEARLKKEANAAILEDPNAGLGEQLKAFGSEIGEAFGHPIKLLKQGVSQLGAGLANGILNAGEKLAGDMNEGIKKYQSYISAINVRLQGTNDTFNSIKDYLKKNVGVTPYIRTEKLYDNVQALAQQGIAFNIEQRAFLETISEEIAATFETANASLLRIVKIQQQDSTASRLGMEAAITSYLNGMFENSEYMVNSFDTVTANILEASAQMSTDAAVEFEYIAQKWLGSLSSVGVSDQTISDLASAIGMLGSGNVEGLNGSPMQNLMIMAASNAGYDYSEMLTKGLDASSLNNLMESVVEYLQQIGESTNKVVKNQYANVFGVAISDLVAVTNLEAADLKTIRGNMMTYSDTIEELSYQMTKMGERIGTEGMLQNLYENSVFSTGMNIASSPALYAAWKITNMINDLTGGINIPAIHAMGSGVDINTTVENLVRLGIVGIGSLGMIGDIIGGIGSIAGGGKDFNKKLNSIGITAGNIVSTSRGANTANRKSGGLTQSASSYVGNSDSSDIYESTMAASDDESKIN